MYNDTGVENASSRLCCGQFGGGKCTSPQVLLSQLSCSCHSGMSPAFFSHDTHSESQLPVERLWAGEELRCIESRESSKQTLLSPVEAQFIIIIKKSPEIWLPLDYKHIQLYWSLHYITSAFDMSATHVFKMSIRPFVFCAEHFFNFLLLVQVLISNDNNMSYSETRQTRVTVNKQH